MPSYFVGEFQPENLSEQIPQVNDARLGESVDHRAEGFGVVEMNGIVAIQTEQFKIEPECLSSEPNRQQGF